MTERAESPPGTTIETTTTTTTETWWERKKRPYWLGWVVPLALLPLLFWWGQVGVRHRIQDDIRDRSVAALTKAGFGGVDVRVRGRDVTLGGFEAKGYDVDAMHDTVRSLTGVRHVDEEFDATAVAAPTTTAAPVTTTRALAPTTTAPAAAPTTTAATAPTTTAAPASTTTAPPPTTTAPRRLNLRGMTFLTASSEPTADGFSIIDEAAAQLRSNPTVNVRIEGHTDAEGNAELNAILSNDRANRVRDELIARGIAPNRMTAQGFGSSVPIADNATPEGRAQNRRIEFIIV